MIESNVLHLIRQSLPALERARPLASDDSLSDLGVGSLSLLTLILDLEEQFNVSAGALSRLTSRSTVGTLVQLCLESEPARN